jgi:GT2 family glycosyltransferase
MPADRYDTNEPYLGPTGGCAMITRECLLTLKRTSGYFFDSRFFCYCEDTDLVLRANLLGYRPVFVNEVLALHEGQASSNKGFNQFIAYHGLRNSTWLVIKLIPASVILRFGLLHFLSHLMTISNHVLHGRVCLLRDTYRDILNNYRNITADRRRLTLARKVPSIRLAKLIAPRFYRKGYIPTHLRHLLRNLTGSITVTKERILHRNRLGK